MDKKPRLDEGQLSTILSTGLPLDGATLEQLHVTASRLREVYDFNGDEKRRAVFHVAARRGLLRGADLRFADLSGVDLSNADLSGADCAFATLTPACLRGADLSGADLRYAELTGSSLSGAKLDGAKLDGATLPEGWQEVVFAY